MHRALVFGTAIEVEELCAVGASSPRATGPDGVTPLVRTAEQVGVAPQAKVEALRAAGAA